MKGNLQVPAYLINLDQSTERLEEASRQLTSAGISFIRVGAFDGRGVDLRDMADCDLNHALKIYGRPLKAGEYGCYKSHIACAQRIIDGGHPHALVFEDDLKITSDLLTQVSAVISHLADLQLDWHLVNLGSHQSRIFTSLRDLGDGHKLVAAHYFPQTAHAILWSRAGALEFVKNYSEVKMTVDNLFRHVMIRNGKGFAVTPPLVTTTDSGSIIDAGQKSSRYNGRRWNYGLLKQRRFWVNRMIAGYSKLTFRKT